MSATDEELGRLGPRGQHPTPSSHCVAYSAGRNVKGDAIRRGDAMGNRPVDDRVSRALPARSLAERSASNARRDAFASKTNQHGADLLLRLDQPFGLELFRPFLRGTASRAVRSSSSCHKPSSSTREIASMSWVVSLGLSLGRWFGDQAVLTTVRGLARVPSRSSTRLACTRMGESGVFDRCCQEGELSARNPRGKPRYGSERTP